MSIELEDQGEADHLTLASPTHDDSFTTIPIGFSVVSLQPWKIMQLQIAMNMLMSRVDECGRAS